MRRRVQLRLAQVLIWHGDDAVRARAILDQLKKDHECLIALGDAALMLNDHGQAHERYEQARDLAERDIRQPEELAKVGGYPYTVEDLIGRGEFDFAFQTIDQWEDTLPAQKLEGLSFFLRGKALFVQKPSKLALRYLELAERVDPRAVHVPEAVWLRANCLMEIGRFEAALAQFARLREDYTASEYFERSEDKIKQCLDALKPEDS